MATNADTTTATTAATTTTTGLTPEQLEEIRTAFDSYDENGDGVLTLEEIAGVMYKLGQVPSIPELRSMFREVDVDGDSTITFVEFCQLMAPRLNKPQFSDGQSARDPFSSFRAFFLILLQPNRGSYQSLQEVRQGQEWIHLHLVSCFFLSGLEPIEPINLILPDR